MRLRLSLPRRARGAGKRHSHSLPLSGHLRRDVGLPEFDHATVADARTLAGLHGWP